MKKPVIEDNKWNILISIWLGFSLFLVSLFLLLHFGIYEIKYVLFIHMIMWMVSYKEWLSWLSGIKTPVKEYDHDLSSKASFSEKYNLSMIIDELHYYVITFLISINLVSVFRPFPIGWDDLGAYMNYPKLLSQASEHIALGKMYAWEMYTGIWFIAWSQTLAFYLNSFAGIISAIVIYLAINRVVGERKTQFDYGLFSALIILMLPMSVFQLAKDMKLDLWLLSISVIAVSIFYSALSLKQNNKIILFFLVWVFIGVAFSIKVTSLLLLLWVLAAITFSYFSLFWLVWFLLLFVWVFSFLDVWSIMNIVVPSEQIKNFGIALIVLGCLCFIGMCIRSLSNKKSLRSFLSQISAIFVWFILVLSPWFLKNIGETPSSQISPKNIITWSIQKFTPDYSTIYSSAELLEKKSVKWRWITTSGTTTNADFWRYFWYEEGINNYLKLPWNLSFQINQKWEFTDITYIFLVLIPALFLFLQYRKESFKYWLIWALILCLLYVVPSPIWDSITSIFWQIYLPAWYWVISLLFLLPLAYFYFTLNRDNKINNLFILNLVVSTIYLGLWAFSAFGIVWYGILMYVLFLYMIVLSLLSIEENTTDKSKAWIYVTLFFVWIYIIASSIPHGITNLRSAWYHDYKMGLQSEEVSIMKYHPEYFDILFELNIWDEFKEEMFTEYRNALLEIIDDTEYASALVPQIQSVENIFQLHTVITQLSAYDIGLVESQLLEEERQRLYEDIMYVSPEKRNKKVIHRVGTFMLYFISENKTRVLEDSLLTKFNTYLFDVDEEVTIERYKELGISYLLLDINAATIDNDPDKSLTKRYENTLSFISNPNIELISTDSVCLEFWRDLYKETGDKELFMKVAWINYSYKETQSQKKSLCLNLIADILVDDERIWNYQYLLKYKNWFENNNIDLSEREQIINILNKNIRNWYKVLIKII